MYKIVILLLCLAMPVVASDDTAIKATCLVTARSQQTTQNNGQLLSESNPS
jgi:hypothetical protein